jgi:UDP-3-O-[3-hydroxymyristoyl] glucosamine N-acyltransferase
MTKKDSIKKIQDVENQKHSETMDLTNPETRFSMLEESCKKVLVQGKHDENCDCTEEFWHVTVDAQDAAELIAATFKTFKSFYIK